MMVADSRPTLHVVLLGVWLGFPNGLAASSRARLLALAMKGEGVDVRVMCAHAVDRAPDGVNRQPSGTWRGVPFEYPGGVSLRASSFARRRIDDARAALCTALRLARLRAQGHLDCVYLYVAGQQWTLVAVLLDLVLRGLRVPVVLELNELPWTLWPRRSLLQRARHPLSGVRGVVAISGFLAGWARREAHRRGQVVEIAQVPILVDAEEQRGQPIATRAEAPTVLFAGDASAQNRDIVRLISTAMRLVWQTEPRCRLICVGADPADENLKALLPRGADGALDERVDMPGFVSRAELLALYASASALLLPLPDDAVSAARFPTKLGEYLVSGRVVVTTDVGEVGAYLKDGESAMVAPAGDAGAFSGAVCRALADPARAAEIAAAGLALARENFHYAKHGAALTAFLERCADGART
jgi:glycosyltransferase involved in cell wall biosynthesis